MYYFPAGDKFLQRHPLITVMLCAAIGGAFAWYASLQLRELRGFGTAPQPLAIEGAFAPAGEFAPGRWVELQGELHFECASTAIVRAATLETMIFGHSSETFVAATDASRQRVFIFQLDHAAICEDAMRRPWRGVLRSASRYDLDRVRRMGFRVPDTLAQPPMLLETFGGPRETRKTLILAAVATALMAMGAIIFWWKYRIAEAKEESGWAPPTPGKFTSAGR
jgi:hypothetical protein